MKGTSETGYKTKMQSQRKKLIWIVRMTVTLLPLFFASIVTIGCGLGDWIDDRIPIPDVTEQTVNALDDAIAALTNESASWQTTLEELLDKLTDEAQATIRNEVANVLSRSIAQTGVEFRCNVDFIGNRVRQALIRIKASFLGEPIPPVKPALCQVVPVAVDRESVPDHVTQLEFYGYDFNEASNLNVFLERTVGGRLNVTSHLTRPTHYAMTLPFGATGVQLDDYSKRFVLEWEGEEISTIAVIQPETPVCESKLERLTPAGITYVPPPKGSGDKDFDEHGPRITAGLWLDIQAQTLSAKVYMYARETESDYTKAEGTAYFPLYTPDPGWRIDGVVGGHSNSYVYTDSNHDLDCFGLGSGGPATRFCFVGDTSGDEAGTRTKIDVTFNELRIELTQTGDCVTDSAVTTLRANGLIRSDVYRRLEPAVRIERTRRGRPFPP